MDKNDIIQVLEAFNGSNATLLAYQQGETLLTLSKLSEMTPPPIPQPAVAPVSTANENVIVPATSVESVAPVVTPTVSEPSVSPSAPAPVAPTASADTTCVKSPLVGVCYTSASPDSPAFVTVGQTVAEGDTLCIVEAMKVMNEIKAPKAGKIIAIPAKSGELVEFGQVLVEIA